MEMPDLRPIKPLRRGRRRLVQIAVAAFMILTFAFATLVNISEWR
jgi:hypothetical protein